MSTSISKDQQKAWSKVDWLLIFLAFGVIYFVWGSTYLANWWAVQVVPPFLLAGCRFFLAGLIMYTGSIFFGRSKATIIQWKNAFFSGIMLFVVGNGLLVWALQFMESGITALVVSFEPLIVVFLLWKMRGQVPKWLTLIGIALGVFGMGLLVGQPEYLTDSSWLIALSMVFVGIFAWAYISVWLPSADLPSNHFLSAALQMLCGGAGLLLIALITGEFRDFEPGLLDKRTTWSFVYLVIGGSIAAFTAFNYLLNKVSPEKVVTNAYVNPVVALLLGWFFNQEHISRQSLIASVLLITGVIVINSRKRRPKKST